jgi:hypothetical protein
MKTTVTVTPNYKKAENKYPYFAEYKDSLHHTIVWFISKGKCIIVWAKTYETTGKVTDNFNERIFTPIIGTITITQE